MGDSQREPTQYPANKVGDHKRANKIFDGVVRDLQHVIRNCSRKVGEWMGFVRCLDATRAKVWEDKVISQPLKHLTMAREAISMVPLCLLFEPLPIRLFDRRGKYSPPTLRMICLVAF